MKIGQIVYVKKGRDKGQPLIVIDVAEDYLYLVDGKNRTLARPKKKNIKHVQIVNYIADLNIDNSALAPAEPIHSTAGTLPKVEPIHSKQRDLQDADIRKKIKQYTDCDGGNTIVKR